MKRKTYSRGFCFLKIASHTQETVSCVSERTCQKIIKYGNSENL